MILKLRATRVPRTRSAFALHYICTRVCGISPFEGCSTPKTSSTRTRSQSLHPIEQRPARTCERSPQPYRDLECFLVFFLVKGGHLEVFLLCFVDLCGPLVYHLIKRRSYWLISQCIQPDSKREHFSFEESFWVFGIEERQVGPRTPRLFWPSDIHKGYKGCWTQCIRPRKPNYVFFFSDKCKYASKCKQRERGWNKNKTAEEITNPPRQKADPDNNKIRDRKWSNLAWR